MKQRFNTKVLLLLVIIGSQFLQAAAQQRIVVRGSDAMILLAQRWSQMLRTTYPAATLDINGGGPVRGINLLMERTAELAQLARPLTAVEKTAIAAKTGRRVCEFPVGIESVLVSVNASNPINEITLEQLKQVFTGTITDWKQLGGRDGRIQLYSTESAVGGSMFFRETVLGGVEFDDTMRGYSYTKAMLKAIGADPDGIGFGGVGEGEKTKLLSIKRTHNSAAVAPTMDNVRSARYPISRYLYWVAVAPLDDNLMRISNWVLSGQGQTGAESVGYYPLNPEDRSKATGILHLAGK